MKNDSEIMLGSREGGGVLQFYIHIGLADFLGFKILNFNIFGAFKKYDYFLGLEI